MATGVLSVPSVCRLLCVCVWVDGLEVHIPTRVCMFMHVCVCRTSYAPDYTCSIYVCVWRRAGGRNGSCLIKGKDISINVCSRQMKTKTMISSDIFSFIHNSVCSLTEVRECGSDLEINHTEDTVDFTKFSPG